MSGGFSLVPLLLAASLSACATPPEATGTFDPLVFFAGSARSRGTIVTALVARRAFEAGFEGRSEGRHLVLDERFRFPEASPLQRWRLTRLPDGRYVGTVETEGSDGRLHPPVPVEGVPIDGGIELDYAGFAPGGDTLLRFRHRMRRQADGTVRNRVRIAKFGIPLASADVVFEKVPRTRK